MIGNIKEIHSYLASRLFYLASRVSTKRNPRGGAYNHGLRLVWVHRELSNQCSTASKQSRNVDVSLASLSTRTLNVISVLNKIDTLQGDYLGKRHYVQSEQHRSARGTPWLQSKVDDCFRPTRTDYWRCTIYKLIQFRAGPDMSNVFRMHSRMLLTAIFDFH